MPAGRILDLGCGNTKQPGAFGVDIIDGDRDEFANQNDFPWPLPADHFCLVYAIQVLEHLAKPIKVMEEIWRVCQHGALVLVSVPRAGSDGDFQNPQHASHWNEGTFGYFATDEQYLRWLGSDAEPRFTHARFHILRYWTEHQARTLFWREKTCKDDLWVLLQAIKDK